MVTVSIPNSTTSTAKLLCVCTTGYDCLQPSRGSFRRVSCCMLNMCARPLIVRRFTHCWLHFYLFTVRCKQPRKHALSVLPCAAHNKQVLAWHFIRSDCKNGRQKWKIESTIGRFRKKKPCQALSTRGKTRKLSGLLDNGQLVLV